MGASGAIFGLIGALAVHFFRHREALSGGQRRLTNILTVAGVNLLIGLQPGIDNWAHLGGLLGGAALTALAGPRFVVETDPVTGVPRVD